ncbi:response regulator [Candidatus Kaiserbacteria bacterium CG10_big_fil_rev_8_21_14_0_10_59_10]|uniref:Response regulator n=1 Tax=Candidatus Kaiserbacteria bacterium CG10_big_fil_rev_8_21_14_0_10_59_10 TaxID=1974612 RepID=A0A2H0U848_9BACT|nr:MAG: response regulator [Candidatus Kaiserbacteria bacterium CG10_big_fil_rev_8_21_14_0_10_59_10]
MNTIAVTRKKVLVIDDNSDILFVMQEALTLRNYDVHLSEIFIGVAATEKSAPDLIYLDISLVGKDGREVARELKSHGGTKNIPIIILTAYQNADELTKEAGADDYLAKPFQLEHLWEMTERYTS